MGWLDSLITGAFGVAQQVGQNWFNANQAEINRDFQSDEAEKNRLFQGNEAALQRDWSSQEAERVRDWEEEMYAKYNSLSGKIAQAEQAGVNPMLAITGNAVSPMSANSSAPSGASAGSVGTPSGSAATAAFVDIIGQIMGVKKIKSQINVDNALAEKYRKEAEGQGINNETLRDMNAVEIMSKLSEIEINTANVGLIASKVLNTNADTDLKIKQIDEVGVRIANSAADTVLKQQQTAAVLVQMAKDAKSIEVFTAQIGLMATQAGVNRNQSALIIQEIHNLAQDYEFNEIIKGFEIEAASRELGDDNFYNSKLLPVIKRTVESVLGWWSGSSTIDLPQKKPARIGF